PRHAGLLAYAAQALAGRQATLEQSRSFERRRLMLEPDPARRALGLIALDLQAGKPQAALKEARAWVHPRQLDTLDHPVLGMTLLARSLTDTGRPTQAVRAMKEAIAHHPAYEAELRYELAALHSYQGDEAASEAALR